MRLIGEIDFGIALASGFFTKYVLFQIFVFEIVTLGHIFC